jgi:hypothetical protein
VVWRFSPAVAEDARSYQFHPSQTNEEQADGAEPRRCAGISSPGLRKLR